MTGRRPWITFGMVNMMGAILDIMMPKMDGLTVLRQVRESGNGIPILLLTAKSQVDGPHSRPGYGGG